MLGQRGIGKPGEDIGFVPRVSLPTVKTRTGFTSCAYVCIVCEAAWTEDFANTKSSSLQLAQRGKEPLATGCDHKRLELRPIEYQFIPPRV